MKRSLILLAAFASTGLARAHYLWATLDPATKTVAVALQELPDDAPIPLAERAAKVRAWGTSPLDLKADGAWLKASTDAKSAGVGIDYGVMDRRDAGRGVFLLQYYAKAAATPEASQTRLGLPVELSVAKNAEGRDVLTVLADGKPAAGADVTVEKPVFTNLFEGKTGADGTVLLPESKGPIAVRAAIAVPGKGVHDGAAYDLTRRYGTLTVGGAPAPQKPFSRRMSEAFGESHTVVSRSAFIETVMGEKLTKAQLVDHLRQREIVNAALDAILSGAPGVPYGAPQKEVLTLLRADLKALGADDPSPADAWPLTETFLQEIRTSAAKGPWFALGVFHVYYGGITNGGRDIGAMIGDQVGYTPAYYLKSDGYRDYLKALNATTLSPEAQAETIRGGRAAYRYIIAVNGDPRFRSAPSHR